MPSLKSRGVPPSKSRGVQCSCGTEFDLTRNDRRLFVVNSGGRGLSAFVYTGMCECYEHRGVRNLLVYRRRVGWTKQYKFHPPPLCRAK